MNSTTMRPGEHETMSGVLSTMAGIIVNVSNSTNYNNTVTEFDKVMGYTLIPIFIVTVTSNLLTIVVAYKLVSLNKNITDFFVFFLAWTDLILGLLVLPIVTASHFNGGIFGGVPVCHFNFFVVNATVQASAFLILVMSIERWVAFVKPLYYKSRFTFTTAKILITTVLLYSTVTSLLPLFGVGEIGNFDYVCMIDWQTKELDGQIMVWFQVILGLASILAVWYFNIAVACSVWRMRVKRQGRTRSHDNARGKMEIKFFRLTACVAIFYSVCWAPYLIRVILVQCGYPRNDTIDFVVTRLAASNSMINPIIYGATKRSYLRGYAHTIKVFWYYVTCCRCIKKPTEEEFRVKVGGRKMSIVNFSSTRSQSIASNNAEQHGRRTSNSPVLKYKSTEDLQNTTTMGEVNLAFVDDNKGITELEMKSDETKQDVSS